MLMTMCGKMKVACGILCKTGVLPLWERKKEEKKTAAAACTLMASAETSLRYNMSRTTISDPFFFHRACS